MDYDHQLNTQDKTNKVVRALGACGLIAFSSWFVIAFFVKPSMPSELHIEPSAYRPVLVTEEPNGMRCMRFDRVESRLRQGCVDPNDFGSPVLRYTRHSTIALAVHPKPESVLILGLGPGVIPMLYRRLLPNATIDVAELDVAVLKVAERFFGFERDDRLVVHLGDARMVVKRLARESRLFDVVIHDVYDNSDIPPHLTTLEFLSELKSLLTDDGVLIANIVGREGAYDHQSETYRKAFGDFYNLREDEDIGGMRLIIATKNELPSVSVLRTNADSWSSATLNFGFDVKDYTFLMRSVVDWDTDARVLTDQYSPSLETL